jgi:hypothetical protein
LTRLIASITNGKTFSSTAMKVAWALKIAVLRQQAGEFKPLVWHEELLF